MATKKSKRSASSKKSSKPASAKQTKAQEAKLKAEAVDAEEPEVVEEVVEVLEVEEPVKESKKKNNQSISDKLAALNPAALIAELIGTFILTAAFIQLISGQALGLLIIALVLAAITFVFMGISGAHFNPAITLAQWINRKINGVKALAYIVAQVLGAVLAFFILTGITTAGFDFEATVKQAVLDSGGTQEMFDEAGGYDKWVEQYYGDTEQLASYLGVGTEAPELYQYNSLVEGKEWVALIAEILGSFVLGLGAAYAYSKRKDCKLTAGLVIGISFITGLVIAGTTTIINPAIAATMGVFSWGGVNVVLWPILVYIIGSVLGATIGFAIYNLLTKNEAENATAIEA